MSYSDALTLDLATVLTVAFVLVRFGRLSHSHPATIYLLFHLYSFTWRLATLAGGGAPLFTGLGPSIEPLREDELVRAAWIADAVLGAMTLGWLRASAAALRSPAPTAAIARTQLSPRIVQWIAAVAIPAGLVGLLVFARVPGLDNMATSRESMGTWGRSSYVLVVQSWTGLMLVALIYVYGFRRALAVPMLAYLALMGYQGFHRFRAVIPTILLIQIYLNRRSLRWPTLRITAVLAAVAILFFPLKIIGRSLQEGRSLSEVVMFAGDEIGEAAQGNAGDQTILDQMAAYLVMMDEANVLYLGKPYLSVFTLAIPRQLWPDKPTLNWHIWDFARPYRPVAECGMVMTFIGDLYVNFSWAGLFLVAPLIAYWLARLHFVAMAAGYSTVLRFTYLIIACNLITVYRDGLVSLFVFTFVNMLPLTVLVALHAFVRPAPLPAVPARAAS